MRLSIPWDRAARAAGHTAIGLICLAIVINFGVRWAASSVLVFPPFVAVIALSMCVLCVTSVTGEADRPIGFTLLGYIGAALAVALFARGATGPAAVIHAIALAFTSQEIFALAPVGLTASLIVLAVFGKSSAPANTRWTRQCFLLTLPGPILPLLSVVLPGEERIVATILLPMALGAAVFLTLIRPRCITRNTIAVLGSAALFYAPVVRGVANSGETAVLALVVLLVFGIGGGVADGVQHLSGGIRVAGQSVFAFGAGVAFQHAVALEWLVERGAPPFAMAALGAVLTLPVIFLRRRIFNAAVAVSLLTPIVVGPALDSAFARGGAIAGISNPAPQSLAVGQAWKWAELKSTGEVPQRRTHSCAVFDARRRELVMVGSDTHGRDWDMSVRRYHLATGMWWSSGIPEPRYTYRIDQAGHRIAGSASRVPWAMHTYNQVVLDQRQDVLWVVSAPLHNHVPALRPIRDIPWVFDLGRCLWRPGDLKGASPVIFPGVVVHDVIRDTLVASAALEFPTPDLGIGEESKARRGGVWELGPDRRRWRSTEGSSPHGASVSGVYDDCAQAMLVFGNRGRFVVDRYDPDRLPGGVGRWSTETLPDGPCTTRSAYPPVPAVYIGLGKTLLLPEGRDGQRRTCLYDSTDRSLTDLRLATPAITAMEFDIAYDAGDGMVLLVTGEADGNRRTRVWALHKEMLPTEAQIGHSTTIGPTFPARTHSRARLSP